MEERTSDKAAVLLPADQRERAMAEALATRVLERAKAPRVVPHLPPQGGDHKPDFATVDRLSRG